MASEASFKQVSDRIALQFSERDDIEIGSGQRILLDQQTTNRDESTTA